jgi:putative PIN family toxin of toxin-antitoxin system
LFGAVRLVLDTNVLVSALLGPARVPAQALAAAVAQGATFLIDGRIEAEYREVLGRPKFASAPASRREEILRQVLAHAEWVAAPTPFQGALPDPDDALFIEVALAGGAYALVTGNVKHFPEGLGFHVLPPATLLAELTGPSG